MAIQIQIYKHIESLNAYLGWDFASWFVLNKLKDKLIMAINIGSKKNTHTHFAMVHFLF